MNWVQEVIHHTVEFSYHQGQCQALPLEYQQQCANGLGPTVQAITVLPLQKDSYLTLLFMYPTMHLHQRRWHSKKQAV